MSFVANLDSVRVKLDRARVHIEELEQIITGLLDQAPGAYVRDDDPAEPTKARYRATDLPRIRSDLSGIVGDAVVNFRSSLDHLAWQLVLLDEGEPGRETQFPIQLRRGNDLPTIRPGIRRMDIRTAIDALQPYQQTVPTSYLSAINHLANVDKHRLLLVMVAALHLDRTYWGLEEGFPDPDWWLNTEPLEEGDVVAEFNFRDVEAPDGFHPRFSFTVKFDEGPQGRTAMRILPAVQFLGACGHSIASLLNRYIVGLFDEEWIAYGQPGARLPATDLMAGFHPPAPGLEVE